MAEEKVLASRDAEQAVIGSVFYDESTIRFLSDKIRVDDFYYLRHQTIFGSMLDLYKRKTPIDSTTLIAELEDKGKLMECGGPEYIVELAQSVPSTANLETYVDIVIDKAIERRIVATCNDIIKDTTSKDISDSKTFLDNVEKRIYKVTSERTTRGLISANSILEHARDMIDEMSRTEFTGVTGLDTGFDDLNKITMGFHGSELIILAARPSMGKTALALNIATNIALQKEKPYVAFFSLEMSLEQLAYRLIAALSRINAKDLTTGRIGGDKEWAKLNFAIDSLSDCNLLFDDSGATSVEDVRSICRKKKAEGQLDLVVIDYLQLLTSRTSGKGSGDNRANEIREISQGLKAMARELNVPVLALSQLSRKVDERSDHMPIMSDLRESGSIEQDADMVILFYRDEYYTKEKTQKPGIADVSVAKNRNGMIGQFQLLFKKECTVFSTLKTNYREDETI